MTDKVLICTQPCMHTYICAHMHMCICVSMQLCIQNASTGMHACIRMHTFVILSTTHLQAVDMTSSDTSDIEYLDKCAKDYLERYVHYGYLVAG